MPDASQSLLERIRKSGWERSPWRWLLVLMPGGYGLLGGSILVIWYLWGHVTIGWS